MIIEKRSRSNLTILDIEGAIRLGESAEFFSQTLEKVLLNETTNILIDFTRINYIDSTGIGELTGYLSKFAGEDRHVILVNPSERILRLLKGCSARQSLQDIPGRGLGGGLRRSARNFLNAFLTFTAPPS